LRAARGQGDELRSYVLVAGLLPGKAAMHQNPRAPA